MAKKTPKKSSAKATSPEPTKTSPKEESEKINSPKPEENQPSEDESTPSPELSEEEKAKQEEENEKQLRLESFRKAGEIHRKVVEFIRPQVKVGAKYLDICEAVEEKIIELGGEIGFPTNVCVNEVAAIIPAHQMMNM